MVRHVIEIKSRRFREEASMFLSVSEKESRYRSVRGQMTEQNIEALIARGSSAVRGDGAAFRFLTNFPNINIPLVLVFFRNEGERPILLVESRFQAMRAEKQSWAEDIRLSTNFFQSLMNILKEKRSEEHTSELQSQSNLVCRLLLEKKKQKKK